jgi:hypothetical protein
MGFRFCFFDGNLRTRNFEQPSKLSKRRSQRVSQSVDSAFRPNVSEDESGDDETKKNSNDAITDVIQVCVGRVTLEDAVEKSERNL